MPQQHPSRVPTPLGPPSDVNIGPLTRSLIAGAKWQGQDVFPAWQTWADDVESVLHVGQAKPTIKANRKRAVLRACM
jgi:hypothetical protein